MMSVKLRQLVLVTDTLVVLVTVDTAMDTVTVVENQHVTVIQVSVAAMDITQDVLESVHLSIHLVHVTLVSAHAMGIMLDVKIYAIPIHHVK
jgi:hypothetical protein